MGYVTFKLPVGTTYKVVNTKKRLAAFKAKMEKATLRGGTRPLGQVSKMSQNDAATVVKNFIADDEMANAYFAAEASGMDLRFSPMNGSNTDVNLYMNVQDVDLVPGRKIFVGLRVAKDSRYWYVIDQRSGQSLGTGQSTKAAALSNAKSQLEKAYGKMSPEDFWARAEDRWGEVSQDEMRERFRKQYGAADIQFSKGRRADLEAKFAAMQAGDKDAVNGDPDAERLQFIDSNFNDILFELDKSGKVRIRC